MTPDVNVTLLDFHSLRGREMVVENEDGSFTIIINARLSHASQLKAYQHAMSHIEKNDFEKADVQAIESIAHKLSLPEAAEKIPAEKYEKRLKAIQRQRRKIQKQLRQYYKDMEFLEKCGVDLDAVALARAEHQKLYGNDF